MAAPVNVSVDFNVTIEPDSSISVFGNEFVAPTNILVAEHVLPVNALYDADTKTGLIEFWEPSANPDDMKVQLANTDSSAAGGDNLAGAYQAAAKQLAKGLERLLCDKFDGSNAVPFSSYSDVEYYKQRDFGRVALGLFAHYMFGHVDATSAITNDAAFVRSMLSVSAGETDETAEGAAARYAAWTKSVTSNVELWDASGSAADANLAIRLVKAIVGKGLDASNNLVVSSVADNVSTDLANIVRQVIGQDRNRAMNEDNSERTLDMHRLLRFYEGDSIYVNIKVKTPSVTVGAGGVDSLTEATLQGRYTVQDYAIKITLGPKEAL